MAPPENEPGQPYPNDYQAPTGDGLSAANGTIFDFYPAIMREKPQSITDAATGWKNLSTHFETAANDVKTSGGKLKPDWTSSAGVPFFTHIDNTEASIREWHGTASKNEGILTALAGAVTDARSKMQTLWDEFKQKMDAAKAQEDNNDSVGEFFRDVGEFVTGSNQRPNDVLKEYTQKAVDQVLEPLANAYSTADSGLSSGTQFRGPTDAAKPSEGAMRFAMTGDAGGPGTGPGSPGPGPAAPGLPPVAAPQNPMKAQGVPPTQPVNNKDTQNVPPPAPVTRPTTPVTQPTPPKQVAGPPPTAPPAPPGQTGTPPAAPSLPGGGLTNPPVAPIVAGLGPTGMGLTGLNNLGGTLPPTAPRLPIGTGSVPPGMPGTPRGGPPGSPNLQGRSGPQAPGSMPPGSSARTPPPQLPGRGGGAPPGSPGSMPPGSRGARGGGGGPGGPGAPALPGRNGGPPAPRAPGSPGSQPGMPGGGPPPPNRTGAPQSLQGTRNGTPQRPTSIGSGFGPPGGPNPPGRKLNGRFGPTAGGSPETLDSARGALRSGLDGRGLASPGTPGKAGPGAPGSRPALPGRGAPGSVPPQGGRSMPAGRERSKNDRQDHTNGQTEWVGDEELFTVDESAPAVIERPEERAPVRRAGPALGADKQAVGGGS